MLNQKVNTGLFIIFTIMLKFVLTLDYLARYFTALTILKEFEQVNIIHV